MKYALLYVLVFGSFISCSSSKRPTDSDINRLRTLVEAKSFEFTADWASPMVTTSVSSVLNSGLLPPGSNASRINLVGNANYLKVFGDSVSANLPYFGERRFGGGYGSSTGIEFDGIPKDYTQIYNSDKNNYTISFSIKNKTEQYIITMDVYPNNSASVSVNTNNRFFIRYDGKIEEIKSIAKE